MEKDLTKLVIQYRYISLIFASIFYLFSRGYESIISTMGVVLSMFGTTLLMHFLYAKCKGDKRKVMVILLIETLGNCMMLIPSGGVYSPYIWYILNTIMIAGVELPGIYLWLNVGAYLLSMFAAKNLEFISYRRIHGSNQVIGFIFIAAMIQLLIRYLKELEEKRKNTQYYLDYTLALYETVYLLSNQQNKHNLILAIMDYVKQTRPEVKIVFLEYKDNKSIVHITSKYPYTRLIFDREKNIEEMDVYYDGSGYVGIPVRYLYKSFGMILVKGPAQLQEIKFIAYVSAMVFQKLELESLNQELVVNHEQNRIANEIHDSVIQKLFGVSCQLFNVSRKADHMEIESMKKELKKMREVITESMGELRTTIYGMSWNKEGKNNFIEKLEAYMATMMHLHELDIPFRVEGNIQYLTLEEQKALYRICCESISNGIRHGKASKISVCFKVTATEIQLKIQDNGKGFNIEKLQSPTHTGLGIRNMKQLAHQIDGIFTLHSEEGQGTVLEVKVNKQAREMETA